MVVCNLHRAHSARLHSGALETTAMLPEYIDVGNASTYFRALT